MIRTLRAVALLVSLPLMLGSCGMIAKIFHRKPKPVDTEPRDQFIGTIETVNPEQHFVLVRTAFRLQLDAGTKLETRPVNGSKSVLSLTPEQKLNFLSADIIEGFPQHGEIVVLPASSVKAPSVTTDSLPLPSLDPGGIAPPPTVSPTGQELPPPVR